MHLESQASQKLFKYCSVYPGNQGIFKLFF